MPTIFNDSNVDVLQLLLLRLHLTRHTDNLLPHTICMPMGLTYMHEDGSSTSQLLYGFRPCTWHSSRLLAITATTLCMPQQQKHAQ
jgi:hypothetical protein